MLSMEHHVLISLQTFLRDIKRLIKETSWDIDFNVEHIKIYNPSICIDFLSTLPCLEDNELTQLIEQLDELLTVSYQLNTKNNES